MIRLLSISYITLLSVNFDYETEDLNEDVDLARGEDSSIPGFIF